MRLLLAGALHVANAAASQNLFFNEPTEQEQQDIYNRYFDIIQGESKRRNYFIDTKVDVDLISEKTKNVFEKTPVLVADLGGSSAKFMLLYISSDGNRVSFEEVSSFSLSFEDEKRRMQRFKQNMSDLTWNGWLAVKLHEFLLKLPRDVPRPKVAALTFSYAMEQINHNTAYFLGCSKNWYFKQEKCELKDKNDLLLRLNQSLDDLGIGFRFGCIFNDSTATYLTSLASGMKNLTSVIVGTGTNGGFVVDRFNGVQKRTLVNPEWARHDFNSLLACVDSHTASFIASRGNANPFEIMVAGLGFLDIIKSALGEFFNGYNNLQGMLTGLTSQRIAELLEIEHLEEIVDGIWCSLVNLQNALRIDGLDGFTSTKDSQFSGFIQNSSNEFKMQFLDPKIFSVEHYLIKKSGCIEVPHGFYSKFNVQKLTFFDYAVIIASIEFKTRAYKMMAPVILATTGNHEVFSVLTNGTIAGHCYDSKLIKYELEQACKKLQCNSRSKKLEMIYHEKNASLYGAALAAYSYWQQGSAELLN